MSKVLTFSRNFPSYHPQKGKPTFFVEKIFQSILDNELQDWRGVADTSANPLLNKERQSFFSKHWECKNHTIRGGNRFKVGDKFSPRVWSDKPYNSKQIIIAPDIEVANVFRFEIRIVHFSLGSTPRAFINGIVVDHDTLHQLAANDGLDPFDFLAWFRWNDKKEFDGQIICWNKNVNY